MNRSEVMPYTKKVRIRKIVGQTLQDIEDIVIVESPFTIFLNDEELVTLLCSPQSLEYLAVGFLVSEGIIKAKEEIRGMRVHEEKGYIYIKLREKSTIVEKLFGKRTITTGCGKGTVFYNVLDSLGSGIVDCLIKLEMEDIMGLVKVFNEKSQLFKNTGGNHSCALCTHKEILMFHEDIGRHNALDKIIGQAFLEDVNMDDKIIITSGRISSEMIIKASKRKVPVIISRSAPTDLSVEIARKLGITLIGFVRGSRMNIYSGTERVFVSKNRQ